MQKLEVVAKREVSVDFSPLCMGCGEMHQKLLTQRRALRSDTFSTLFVACKSNVVEIGDLGDCYAESGFGHRGGFWAVRAAVCAVGPTRPNKSRQRQQPNFEIPWRATQVVGCTDSGCRLHGDRSGPQPIAKEQFNF